jgi:hypothetical protein
LLCFTFSPSLMISCTAMGDWRIVLRTLFSPSSMRLAISTSPSRVSSETEPILRRYIRTGSLLLARVGVLGDGLLLLGNRDDALLLVFLRGALGRDLHLGARVDDLDLLVAEDAHQLVDLSAEPCASAGRASLISS